MKGFKSLKKLKILPLVFLIISVIQISCNSENNNEELFRSLKILEDEKKLFLKISWPNQAVPH